MRTSSNRGALGPSFAKQVLASKTLSRWVKPIANKYADIAGFRRVGLKYDDILQEESDEVQRALNRLTPEEKYDRAYRIRVAINQSMLHSDLPKDQWLQPEQDKRYLTDHIRQIEQENEEREAFDTSNIVKPSKH